MEINLATQYQSQKPLVHKMCHGEIKILEEKEIIKEVDESVYHGNETFILPAETEIEPIIQNIIENIIIHPRSSRSNSVVSKCSDALTEKVTEITDKVRPLN